MKLIDPGMSVERSTATGLVARAPSDTTVALWQPIRVRHRNLRSRLVLPPMASATPDASGHVTAETLDHYDRLVTARHAIAFVEYTYVEPLGRSEEHQLGLHSDAHEQGLSTLARVIAAQGAVPGLQLTHGGGKTEPALIGGVRPLGASAVPIPAHGGDLPAPRAMTAAEADAVIDSFVHAALRAARAGFEVVEIHAAHGYLFNQWLSPITNRRTDRHGGRLDSRAGLLVELLRRLRGALDDAILISVRFPAQDRLEGGLTLHDGIWLARQLAAAGVDLFDVSSGLGGWRRGRRQRGEGYLVDDAAVIRREAGVTVIGVGGIETMDYAESAIVRGDADMLAVGRASLQNPAWPSPVRHGR